MTDARKGATIVKPLHGVEIRWILRELGAVTMNHRRQIVYLVRRVVAVGIAALTTVGCASVTFYPYHPDDEKLAQSAQMAFKEAALSKSLAAERDAIEKLLAREIAAVRRDQASLRDEKITAFLAASTAKYSWDAFDGDITKRLVAIIGIPDAESVAKRLRTVRNEIDQSSRNLAMEQDTYYIESMKKGKTVRLACNEKTQELSPSDPELVILIRTFKSACKRLLNARKGLDDLLKAGGLLKESSDEFDSLTRTLAMLTAKTKEASDAFDTTLAEFKKKLAEGKTPGKVEEIAASLKAEFGKLDKVAEDAQKTSASPVLKDLGLSAKIEKFKRQKKAVDDLLTALADGKASLDVPASEGTSLLLRLAASVSGFEKAIDPRHYPQVSVLMLESELLRLEVEASEKRLARAKELLVLAGEKRAAFLEEIGYLDDALVRLRSASTSSCPKKTSLIADYQNDKQGACRNDIAGALISYSLAWAFGRIPAEEADYRKLGVEHEYALDQSEIALGQAEALISAPLGRLVALYGSGLKPEHLSNLIQAIGLGAIAVNVK